MLTEAQVETLEYIFECMEDDTKAGVLSQWERSFMKDQKERYDQYQVDTKFSDKQWAIVEKCEKALVNMTSTRGAR